ncbi:hypothetical protein M9458_050291, partial [Cirrhinus mrigala]
VRILPTTLFADAPERRGDAPFSCASVARICAAPPTQKHAACPFCNRTVVAIKREPVARRDRIVVSTLRCGRSNPGSNPGHGSPSPPRGG